MSHNSVWVAHVPIGSNSNPKEPKSTSNRRSFANFLLFVPLYLCIIMSSKAAGIFATLDAPFMQLDKKVEPIVWQGKDILIQQVFDLKIPALCGSTVNYTFTTEIGDISFYIEFTTPGRDT